MSKFIVHTVYDFNYAALLNKMDDNGYEIHHVAGMDTSKISDRRSIVVAFVKKIETIKDVKNTENVELRTVSDSFKGRKTNI